MMSATIQKLTSAGGAGRRPAAAAAAGCPALGAVALAVRCPPHTAAWLLLEQAVPEPAAIGVPNIHKVCIIACCMPRLATLPVRILLPNSWGGWVALTLRSLPAALRLPSSASMKGFLLG